MSVDNRGTNGFNGRSFKSRGRKSGRRKKIRLIAAAAVFVITISGFIFVRANFIDSDSKAANSADGTNYESVAQDITIPETVPEREIYVEGINIKGLTREELGRQLQQKYPWNLTLDVDGSEAPLTDLIAARIDQLTAEVFSVSGADAKEEYALDLSDLEELVKAEVEKLAATYNVGAKNGTLIGIDSTTGSYEYGSEENGRMVKTEQLTADIMSALNASDYDRMITVAFDTVAPERTKAQAKEQYKQLGRFVTKTTANAARNTNIRIACEAIDGMLLKPGEEFSFNLTTGNRTTEKGYQPAGAYVNGILVEEPGGGVCQVSTAVYNAAILSGVEIVERNNHSFAPSYINSGEDAMVSYDGYSGPDLRFVNNSGDNLMMRANFADRTVTISLVGIPVLEPGVEVRMKSEKISDTTPPASTYEEDQSLEPGVEVVAKQPQSGSRWETKLQTLKDGQIISEEYLHRSTYRGKPGIIKRNTSGVVIPKETAPVAPTEPVETAPLETLPSESLPPDESSAPGDTQIIPGPNPSETSPATPPMTAPAGPGGGPGETGTTPSEPNGPGTGPGNQAGPSADTPPDVDQPAA